MRTWCFYKNSVRIFKSQLLLQVRSIHNLSTCKGKKETSMVKRNFFNDEQNFDQVGSRASFDCIALIAIDTDKVDPLMGIFPNTRETVMHSFHNSSGIISITAVIVTFSAITRVLQCDILQGSPINVTLQCPPKKISSTKRSCYLSQYTFACNPHQ